MPLSERLIKVLACPACKGALQEVDEKLLCSSCALKFPVRDGIPVLLLDEAEKA